MELTFGSDQSKVHSFKPGMGTMCFQVGDGLISCNGWSMATFYSLKNLKLQEVYFYFTLIIYTGKTKRSMWIIA